LDKTLRLHPESTVREAAAGLLQLGFGLYQLVSQDGQFSVQRDGLASPFLLVLPYLGMAAVNTVINVLDPAYSAVTVLDISPAARYKLNQSLSNGFLSPRSIQTSYFRDTDNISPRSASTSLNTPAQPPSPSVETPAREGPPRPLHIDISKPIITSQLVQSPESTEPPPGSFLPENGSWNDFVSWLSFAYDKRIDVSPVDRLYQTPWLSHTIIIGEFLYTSTVGLLIPLVILAVVGGWTHFQSSNYGLSLAFNLIALFGLPLTQFMLYLRHLIVKTQREFRSRKEFGTFYSEAGLSSARPQNRTRGKRDQLKIILAQSVGIYFPTGRTVVVGYTLLILGVSITEFILVGMNLQRTLNCQELI
jgi:hypothetical protein